MINLEELKKRRDAHLEYIRRKSMENRDIIESEIPTLETSCRKALEDHYVYMGSFDGFIDMSRQCSKIYDETLDKDDIAIMRNKFPHVSIKPNEYCHESRPGTLVTIDPKSLITVRV